jgi:hypothetical protein
VQGLRILSMGVSRGNKRSTIGLRWRTLFVIPPTVLSALHCRVSIQPGLLRGAAACGSKVRDFRKIKGSALLAVLCITVVLGISLASYLTVCYRTLEMSSRALRSGYSVTLAENGLEEALWALNKNDWSAWTLNGTTATRTIGGFAFDNGVSGQVNVRIESYDGSAGTRTVTATGTLTTPDGATSRRTLTSSSVQAPLLVNAVAATTGNVTFSSGGTIDSYDSIAGSYESQSPRYSAIVVSNASSAGGATIQLTNAQVKGYVASTFAAGPSFGSGARVIGPTTSNTVKIDSARISTSPYQPVFTIKTISGAGTVLANPSTGSTTTIGSPAATNPEIFYSSGLDMTGGTKIKINGPVRLVINGDLNIGRGGGTPSIEITPNGTLEVFTTGNIAIHGNGIENVTKDPRRVAIFSTNTLTGSDMNTMSTAVPYYGIIYMPAGQFNLLGSATVYGAVVAKGVAFTGAAPVVHYDEQLRNVVWNGIETPFSISNWRESTASGSGSGE